MPGGALQNLGQITMDLLIERQNWERFGELVLAESGLHDQLRATDNQEAFIALAVRLGAEHGCVFTAPMVAVVVREQRRLWQERWL